MAKKIKHKNLRRKKITRARLAKKRKPAAPARKKSKFNKTDLAEFRRIIAKKKDELLDDIRHISDDTLKKSQKDASGDISGYTYHMADVATDNYDREFSLELASNERDLLYEFDDALKRIDEGSFGICEDCDNLITKVRLRAVPSARLCMKCQAKREAR